MARQEPNVSLLVSSEGQKQLSKTRKEQTDRFHPLVCAVKTDDLHEWHFFHLVSDRADRPASDKVISSEWTNLVALIAPKANVLVPRHQLNEWKSCLRRITSHKTLERRLPVFTRSGAAHLPLTLQTNKSQCRLHVNHARKKHAATTELIF